MAVPKKKKSHQKVFLKKRNIFKKNIKLLKNNNPKRRLKQTICF
jgi:ribosomal protein L32